MNNKRILLVEDDPNFGIILGFFKNERIRCTVTKNGKEGFEKFKKFQFNLCILDVMMPYKDGFTLARK